MTEIIKYKVNGEKYLEIANYIRGIRGVEEEGTAHSPHFVCKSGAISFLNSGSNVIAISNEIKFSDDEKLNKELVNQLEARLKN